MKDFLLDLTRIIEVNARIYWSIILSIALCLILFMLEAVDLQYLLKSLDRPDQILLKQAADRITQIYTWLCALIMVAALFWPSYQYLNTRKKLGLFVVK